MKRFTYLSIILSLITGGIFAQNLEDGINIGKDPVIVDAPENEKWLTKEGRVNPAATMKSIYFYDGFEEDTEEGALPEGWVQKRTATPNDEPEQDAEQPRWFRNSASYGFENWEDYVFSGSASMAIGYTAEDFTWAISPEFHIPDTEGDVFLTYWAWINNALPQGFDDPVLTNYFIKVKSEGEWITLYSYFGEDGETNFFDEQLSHSMNPFKGQDVQIAFVYEYFGWQMAVDDVVVGETLEDDFGVENLGVFPSFGLLEGDNVAISADVYCGGINPGTTDVSLVVNGDVVETITTGELELGGDSEFVEFHWSAGSFGYYDIEIVLPEDDFVGNNTLSTELYINHYYNFAEDFENFEFDELGIPELVFPPAGWSINDPQWVGATTEWAIFDDVSAMMIGRIEEGEKMLVTHSVELTGQDEWISFYLEGVNNAVIVEEGADPEGHSTFQLKYSENADGPWTDLGEPIEFVPQFDEDDNLIMAANALRYVEYDISELDGSYHFAFATTSTFDLVIDGNVYNSFVLIDNIIITGEYVEPAPVYSITMPLEAGEYDYKYFVVGDEPSWDMGEWAGDPNRSVLVEEDVTVSEVWGDQPDEDNGEDNGDNGNGEDKEEATYMVTFEVDMTDAMIELDDTTFAFDPDIHHVFIAGSFGGDWNWQEPGSHPDLEMLIGGNVVTSVTDVQVAENAINLFPNPARNQVNIHAENNINMVEVYDIMGKQLHKSPVSGSMIQLDVSGFDNGIYIVRVHTENGIATQKLQINQ